MPDRLPIVFFVASVLHVVAAPSPAGAAPQELQLVWTCPIHREVTESAAGKCPQCERDLIATSVRDAWSCPLHSVISEAAPGRCPICARDLYLVSEEVTYACPMHPEVSGAADGTCPICNMRLEPSSSIRPHQDHNPKHGGIFFMAPDNWHHLEGAYPESGVFRVYFFDNFSAALDARQFKGRAVLKESFDSRTKQTKEELVYPLLASDDGAYLEARVGSAPLPREITAKIQLAPSGPFERFDFVFADLSREATSEPAPPPSAGLAIPESPRAIARAILERHERVRRLVSRGALAEIYIPALEAKDLGLALESRLDSLAPENRAELQWALKELVRSAWLLDDYGDLGNREKVQVAYDLFEAASETIGARFEVTR